MTLRLTNSTPSPNCMKTRHTGRRDIQQLLIFLSFWNRTKYTAHIPKPLGNLSNSPANQLIDIRVYSCAETPLNVVYIVNDNSASIKKYSVNRWLNYTITQTLFHKTKSHYKFQSLTDHCKIKVKCNFIYKNFILTSK